MVIKEVTYPVNGKKKYLVLHNGKEYTCYIHPFMSPGYTVCWTIVNKVDTKKRKS